MYDSEETLVEAYDSYMAEEDDCNTSSEGAWDYYRNSFANVYSNPAQERTENERACSKISGKIEM
jgi:SMC interacting uncharacterized protein involved in chromosome segregation